MASTNGIARVARPDAASSPSGSPHADATVAQVAELQERDRRDIGFSERLAHRIAMFAGSMLFVWLHVALFTTWIGVNVLGVLPFDPPPFGLLTIIVSLEAIFLSTFVLISQNQQGAEFDKRAKIDLQVNLIAEREITKIMTLLDDIRQHLGLEAHDVELEEMKQQTHVEALADATDRAEGKGGTG